MNRSFTTSAGPFSSTTTTSSHRRDCTEQEAEAAECMHGECFASPFHPPGCSCDEGYSGTRCETFEIPDVFGIRGRTAMKIGISVVVVVFIAVIVIIVVFYIRYRRTRQTSKLQPLTNSEESLDIDADQPRPAAPVPNPDEQPVTHDACDPHFSAAQLQNRLLLLKSSLDVKFFRATNNNPHQLLPPPDVPVCKAPSRERLRAVTSETLREDEPAADQCGDNVVIINTIS